MRWIMLLAVLGCGGGNDPQGLDPALNGTWVGPATLAVTGSLPQGYTGQITVAVAGRSATISGVCFSGSGSISAEGSGRSAVWQGSLACPPVQFTNCNSVIQTLQSGTIILNGSALTAQASGTVSGCNISAPFQIAMTATKT